MLLSRRLDVVAASTTDWIGFGRGWSRSCLIAAAAVATATLVRLALDPLVHSKGPYLFFGIAVIGAALGGGLRAGLIATLLSIPVCDYLFIDPRYTWFVYDQASDSIMLLLFVILGCGISIIIERLNRSNEMVRESARALRESEQQLGTVASVVPGILFTMDADGSTEYINKYFFEYSGIDHEIARTAGWMEVVHAEDRAGALTSWAAAVAEERDLDTTFRLRRSDGAYRWFRCRAVPVHDSTGRPLKWVGFCADVDDQKQLEHTLVRRSQSLAESNKNLSNFANVASHDLQEPLRTVGLFTRLLVERNRDRLEAGSEKLANYAIEGVERMQRLIQDLLAYARATGSALQQKAPTDFNSVFDTAVTQLRSVITESNAEVSSGRLPTVVANHDAMVRVFQNLIGNGIKYRSSEQPHIRVSATEGEKEWIFSVQDNGIGFDMQYGARIFEAFERLDSGVRGTGLGLPIVKHIVERHGGRVWAESEPGRGSKFFFTVLKYAEPNG